jgi:hypothetical protein
LKKEDYFNKVKNSENASKKAKHNQNDFDENIFDVILRWRKNTKKILRFEYVNFQVN